MPHAARQIAESGYYHVVLRGNGRQIIFADDDDRLRFLELCIEVFERFEVDAVAWCLMDNHVHLLLCTEDGALSPAIHDLATRYARYFNAREGRVGHLFQDRFKSKPIESDAYLLEAVRYIHDNPEKGCICAREDYRWSSYAAYARGGATRLTKTDVILDMLGGKTGFETFSQLGPQHPYSFDGSGHIPTEDAFRVAAAVLGGASPDVVKSMPAAERGRALIALRDAGLTVRQIERLTGIGHCAITKATKSRCQEPGSQHLPSSKT